VRHRQRFGRLLNFYERAACRRVRRELDHYAVRSSPGGSAAAQIR
jgi:hypothetical protein